jgi:hypothetical protein
MSSTRLISRLDVSPAIVGRLCRDFAGLSRGTVERRVADVGLRGRHLGVPLTPEIVEHLAREHFLSRVKSEPPSARRAEPSPGE